MSDLQEPPLDEIPLLGPQLAPLRRWLRNRNVIEISINEPGRVWVQEAGTGYRAHIERDLDEAWALDTCKFLANWNRIRFREDLPVLGCRMPGGHRFHAVLGRENVVSGIAISIRSRRDIEVRRESYGWEPGRDFSARAADAGRTEPAPPAAAAVGSLEWIEWLVARGFPVLVSGGTSTGKTTFVNKILIPRIPENNRVITVEDTHELYPEHGNRVQLLVNRVEGRNLVTYQHLIDSVTRLNPDTVIVGELSVDNAYPCLRMLNMGHASFLATVHANNPLEALEAFRRNIELSGQASIGAIAFLARTLEGVVQLVHDGDRRRIAAIERVGALDWRALVDETGTAAALTRLAAGSGAVPAAAE